MGATFRTNNEGRLVLILWDYDGVTGKCGTHLERVEIDLGKENAGARIEYDIEEGGE